MKPEPVSMKASIGRAELSRPAEQCQALQNGRLRLLPTR
jgi:hypothetical protein